MELIYLIMLLLCVVALNWRFLGLHRVFGFGGGGDGSPFYWGKSCRWKLDPSRKGEPRQRYVCRHCGADAFTDSGRAPDRCMRQARDL